MKRRFAKFLISWYFSTRVWFPSGFVRWASKIISDDGHAMEIATNRWRVRHGLEPL